ncbi:MAG TPA: acetolactate synthase small subunit [Beijerinckiaceae bacterium]|nr:acetolactate synthase small subunit [Beijerinckiaceae bacterium]
MKSHYSDPSRHQSVERRTLAIIVDNEPGVLARIAGMFSGRGYNIESLTVSETEHEKHLSRITVVTRGTPEVIDQIKAQLDRLVPVHRVVDLTLSGSAIERELALVKVAQEGATRSEHRMEALRLATAFNARTVDATLGSFIFEIAGTSDDVERFVSLLGQIGLVEVARTGIAAITRGAGGL